MSQSDITTITDPLTIPSPPLGCEHPTYDELQQIFARNAHDKTERMLKALRIQSLTREAQLALLSFGRAGEFASTTNHRTTVGVQIAEEITP